MRDLAARAWVEVADLLDLQLSPLGLLAIEALAPGTGDAVLDIGCGAGQSVLQLAERVGPAGRVTGVDIAPLVLDVARRRGAGRGGVNFIEADAQTLAQPDRRFDCLFSRFGVMAFADPAAAFANFHRMMKPGGRLAFVCWRALEENELDLLPLLAAGLEDRLDPTPFSFADPGHIRKILEAAGFRDIAVKPHDVKVSSGGIDAMLAVLMKVGPLGRILRENPQLRGEAEPRVKAALAELGDPAAVSLNAAVWVVSART
ncbi:MAG: methyltransferase domain-containing protein [Alphaproteobacteria bacterium]|nr:methyltransferase domain-containing protein [Alphaproteobacteria bacterium]